MATGRASEVRVAAKQTVTIAGVDRTNRTANAKKVAYGRRRRPAIHFFEGRAQAIPYPDGSFDRVTAVVSFHHMEDPDRVLTEVHRVLRAGGRFVLMELPPSKTPSALFHWFAARRGEDLSFSNPDERGQELDA